MADAAVPALIEAPELPLSDGAERFCDEYLRDLNGAAAARRSGYSGRWVHNTASDLLKDPRVHRRVLELMAARSERTGILADRVLREMADVGFAEIGQLFERTDDGLRLMDIDQVPEGARRAIASVKVQRSTVKVDQDGDDPNLSVTTTDRVIEVRMLDKGPVLRTIAQHLGMLIERREHSGPGGGPIPLQHAIVATYRIPENGRDGAASDGSSAAGS